MADASSTSNDALTKSADFPLGSWVRCTGCYGTQTWDGEVIGHPGPYSVTYRQKSGTVASCSAAMVRAIQPEEAR